MGILDDIVLDSYQDTSEKIISMQLLEFLAYFLSQNQ